jgi:hypothetical protein
MEDHGYDRLGALEEFQRSSRRLLPEFPNQSQIWSHLRPERRYPEQFPLIFSALSKDSEGSRRPPGAGFTDDRGHHHGTIPTAPRARDTRASVAAYPSARRQRRRIYPKRD